MKKHDLIIRNGRNDFLAYSLRRRHGSSEVQARSESTCADGVHR